MKIRYPKIVTKDSHVLTYTEWLDILKHAWEYSKENFECTIKIWTTIYHNNYYINITCDEWLKKSKKRFTYLEVKWDCYMWANRTIEQIMDILKHAWYVINDSFDK